MIKVYGTSLKAAGWKNALGLDLIRGAVRTRVVPIMERPRAIKPMTRLYHLALHTGAWTDNELWQNDSPRPRKANAD